MDKLGRIYEKGRGVRKDLSLARQWFEKAAGLGNADAMNELGNMSEHGRGAAKNYQQAARWYRKAACLGSPEAIGDSTQR
jgi:uncharacterized protein